MKLNGDRDHFLPFPLQKLSGDRLHFPAVSPPVSFGCIHLYTAKLLYFAPSGREMEGKRGKWEKANSWIPGHARNDGKKILTSVNRKRTYFAFHAFSINYGY